MTNLSVVCFIILAIGQFIIVSAQTYTTDGFGNSFLFPQCTTFLNDGSVAVFHCNVNGVNGQQGISIFNPQTNNQSTARSISLLRQKENGPIPPVFSVWEDVYDTCGTMFNINRTIDQLTIELIAFSLPISSIPWTLNVLIDRDGYYYGEWSDIDRPRPILTLTINHVPRRFVVQQGNNEITSIDSNDQTSYQTMSDEQFWVQTKSLGLSGKQQSTNGVDKLFWSSVADSTISSAGSTITIYTFHFTVNQSTIKTQLVSTIYEPEYDWSYYSTNVIGQFSLNPLDGSIIYSLPGMFWNGSPGELRRVFPSFNYQPFNPAKGEIAEIIQVAGSGGIGVFHSDSAIITCDGSVMIYKNNHVISQITELSEVTDQARANGVSSSLAEYVIISIHIDNSDRIYLTNRDWSIGMSYKNGVLIMTRTGQFIDYYSGFDQTSSSFVDQQGLLVIHADAKLSLFNMTTHQLVREIEISGVHGGMALDLVNGGYVVSVSDDEQYLLQFFTADYQLNTSVVQIPGRVESLSNPVIDSEGRIYVLQPSSNPYPSGTGNTLTYKLQVFDPHTHQLLFETDWDLKNYKANNGVIQNYPTLAIDPNTNSILVRSRDTPSFRTVSFVDRLPPPSAVGDPEFTGLRGQSFQIHGIDGGIYAIISQYDMQLNSKFVFLKDGKCPIHHSIKQQQNCWSHPGSYFAEIALKTTAGDHVSIVGGAYNQGFRSVVINGKEIRNKSCIRGLDSSLELLFIDSFHVKLSINQWIIEIDNSDGFINLSSVVIKDWNQLTRTIQPHGLLGQTWRSNSNKKQKVIEGRVDDYLIESTDIYGTDFMYNRFDTAK